MAKVKQMNNSETAAHLREWVDRPRCSPFAWPTDACGYDQHMRFVRHRNEAWTGGTGAELRRFVLDYADALDDEPEGEDSDPRTPSYGVGFTSG